MEDADELFRLIETRAARGPNSPNVKARPPSPSAANTSGPDWKAGMMRAVALEMADRLDVWILQVLRLRPDAEAGEDTSR